MPRIYCLVKNCGWNKKRHKINDNKNSHKHRWNYKYICSKNNIHLSSNGVCLDFKGKI